MFMIFDIIMRCFRFGMKRIFVIDIVGFIDGLFFFIVEVFYFMFEEIVKVDIVFFVLDLSEFWGEIWRKFLVFF